MSSQKDRIRLMGKKVGMSHFFDEDGRVVACTLIEAEPNVVSQIRTLEKDGYQAVQLAHGQLTVNDEKKEQKNFLFAVYGIKFHFLIDRSNKNTFYHHYSETFLPQLQ